MKLKRLSYLLLMVGILVCGTISVDAATKKSISEFETYMEDKGYDVDVTTDSLYYDYDYATASTGDYDSDDYEAYTFYVYESDSDAIEKMADAFDSMEDTSGFELISKSNVESDTTSSTASFSATYTLYGVSFYVSAYRINETILTGIGTSQTTVTSTMAGFGYGASSSSSKDNNTLLIVVVVAVIAVIIYFSTKKKNPQTVTYVVSPEQGPVPNMPVVDNTPNVEENNSEQVFCSACGTKNKSNSKFCIKCGSPLEK